MSVSISDKSAVLPLQLLLTKVEFSVNVVVTIAIGMWFEVGVGIDFGVSVDSGFTV